MNRQKFQNYWFFAPLFLCNEIHKLGRKTLSMLKYIILLYFKLFYQIYTYFYNNYVWFKNKNKNILPWYGKHWIKAFPFNPCGHLHMGIWLYTSHKAFWPQVPGHGSIHLFLMHALSWGHSLLRTHSGLHILYGSP